MAKITLKTDCGNSPKMEFLKDFNVAFANSDVDYLASAVSDTIVWNIIGDKTIAGKENFKKELVTMQSIKVAEMELNHLLSDGKEGAASGVMTMENGVAYAFSDVYEFTGVGGTQLQSITSFVIEI